MAIEYAGRTHPGRQHPDNEDAIGWKPESGLFLVADGMGGHSCGEIASQIVCNKLLARTDSVALEASVIQAHEEILKATVGFPERTGMASTVVAVRIIDNQCTIVWVGDSRAYLWRKQSISRITRDHSLLEVMRDHASFTEEQIRNHPNRNVVTQSLGLEEPAPSVENLVLKHGDWLLLCSDGLNDELSDEEIETILQSSANPQEAVEQLIREALEKGGRDNVSVVVVKPEIPEPMIQTGLWAKIRRLFGPQNSRVGK